MPAGHALKWEPTELSSRWHKNQVIQCNIPPESALGSRHMWVFFQGSWKLDLLCSPKFPHSSFRTERIKQCHSLPRRVTATSSLAHCSKCRVGSDRLLRYTGGAGLNPRRPSTRCYRSSSQQQVNSGRWAPLHTCLLLLLLLGDSHPADWFHHCQASRPAEPFGKEVTESSAHWLRIPKTISRRSQPSFCKRKKSPRLWKSTPTIRCHKNHLKDRAWLHLLLLLLAESTANRQSPCNTRFIFMLQHFLCVCLIQMWSKSSWKQLLISHMFLKKGREEEQKDIRAWRQPVEFWWNQFK